MPTVKGRSHHARMCSPMQCEQPLMWITGANFHGAMVATAPRRKTPYRALSCEELDPALIFSLCFVAFVQKITFFLGKSTKTVATRAALFDSDTPNRLPAGVSLRTCPLPSSPAPSDHVSSSAVLDDVSTSAHFCASTTTSSSCVASVESTCCVSPRRGTTPADCTVLGRLRLQRRRQTASTRGPVRQPWRRPRHVSRRRQTDRASTTTSSAAECVYAYAFLQTRELLYNA